MKKSYKIDSKYILRIVVLIMEDIYEKLNLIDYKDLFCKTLNLPLINKLYFAIDEEKNRLEKFDYYFKLCNWIMNLSKVYRILNSLIKKIKKMPLNRLLLIKTKTLWQKN